MTLTGDEDEDEDDEVEEMVKGSQGRKSSAAAVSFESGANTSVTINKFNAVIPSVSSMRLIGSTPNLPRNNSDIRIISGSMSNKYT